MAEASGRKPVRGKPASGKQVRDLTRAKVIEAGLWLVDREGPDSLTMRRLADRLGVTPMAVYNHVRNKKELLAALAEQVLGEVRFDGGHDDWRKQIEHCFAAFRGVCLRHPGVTRLLEMADVAPVTVFAPMDVTLRALGEVGIEPRDALRAYFVLVGFTLGQVSYQVRGPFPDLEPAAAMRTENLAERDYIQIGKLDGAEPWDFDAAFSFGLTLILDGLVAAAERAAMIPPSIRPV